MSLAKQAIGDVTLTEIRRQRHQEDRDIATLFYDKENQGEIKSQHQVVAKGREIFQALNTRGAIDAYDTQQQALENLVQDYLANPADAKEKLVLGHARVEVEALNSQIRKGLQAQGKLSSKEVEFKAKDNGLFHQLSVAQGDRIRFTAREDALGVINGTKGSIQSIKESRKGGWDITVQVESEIEKDNGRLVTFNNHNYNAITHNYASTVHKAQGQGKAEVYHLLNVSMMDNQSALVAFTRLTSGSYTMYGSSDEVERVEERLGLDRLKGSAMAQGVKEAPENEYERLIALHEQRLEIIATSTPKPVLTMEDKAWVQEETGLAVGATKRQTLTKKRERGQEM